MIPNLTIRQLQTFREVMRAGSISEASRTLGRTQPAVSAMIANLEAQLGFPLFQRERGRLVPCPEAHYLREEAEAVLDRLDRTARTMAEFGTLDRGSLRIACHPAASGFFMPGVLAEFLRDRPETRADLMMRSSQVVEDLIASQEYDIGLAETPAPRPSIQIEAYDLECVVALPAADPLARAGVLGPADLSGYPLAMLFDEHPLSVAARAVFEAAGAALNRRFVLRTHLPALQLVGAGLCGAVVDPISAATTPAPAVAFRAFRPAIRSGIAILLPAHRPMSQATRAFRSLLRGRMAEIAGAPPGAASSAG